jgi:hypothetical protein
MILFKYARALSAFAFYLSIAAPAARTENSNNDTGAASTSLNVEWLSVTGVNQPITPDQTGAEVDYTLDGKEATVFVPVEADTYLWKDSDVAQGDNTGLLLRDARYSEGLVRLQVDVIPKGAQILKASLRFKVQGVQNKGQAATFAFFRILTPWTEAATWHKPQPDAQTPWNGLQPGKDYDPAPFAQLPVASLDDKMPGGQILSIPGFDNAIEHWRDGSWPNQGFLITLSGKALQLGIPSREAVRNARTLQLGGPTDAAILLSPNQPLLSHIVLTPDDLLGAQIQVTVAKTVPAKAAAGDLKVYAVKGDDLAPAGRELLGSFPLKDLPQKGPCTLTDVSAKLRDWLRSGDTTSHFLLASDSASGAVDLSNVPDKTGLILKVRSYPKTGLFQVPVRPRDGVWTHVTDGHLNYAGQRLRLWGVVGFPDAERLVDMGFNAQRVHEPSAKVGLGKTYSTEGVKRGEMEPYTKGDGSQMDLADKHFADLKAHGMFVMLGALLGTIPYNSLQEDGSFVSGGEDWVQWKDAMDIKGDNPAHYTFIDERLQKAKLQHAKNILTHLNQYTGKTYGQEENIAIYEVDNENGFVDGVLGSGLKKWPPYFRDKLRKRWNAWLLQRYGDDEGLKKAWGKVEAGESLAQGTVQPGPDFEDRLKFPEKRGDDIVHFMIDVQVDFDQKFTAFCRSLAPTGTGVNVVPFSFDTMYRPSLQWAYEESRGGVMSMGMYFWDLKSQLEKPPGAYVIDSFTPKNTPVVLYETNIGRPNPYRSEYPLRLAALASTQDWDGVFWHYWGPVEGEGELPYLTGTLAPPVSTHYWMAVHHENDPVMCTAMALASRIFLGRYLPPAPEPQTIKIGAKALYSYSSFRGINVAQSTFSRGSRLEFDPQDDSGVTEDGKPMPRPGRVEHAVAGSKYVTWDWPNARLIIDAPNVKAYVGKTDGLFRFSDGITFGNVNTPFITFAIESMDGKPLAGPDASSQIIMGGVFEAKNSGFAFNYSVPGGPMEQAAAVRNRGHPPVLVDKVDYSVWFPQDLNGTFKSYDFALRQTQSQSIAGANQVSQQGATPFLSVLDIDKWSAAKGNLPVAQATVIDTDNSAVMAAATGSGDQYGTGLKASDLVFPVPGMDWNMDYLVAHKFIENSPLVFTTFSRADLTANPAKTISVTDLRLDSFWNNTTDTVISFQDNRMTGVEVTLTAPPPVTDVIAQFSAFLGEPAEKKLEAQYGTTRVVWKGKDKAPDIVVTESQGIMKLLYQMQTAR